MKTEKAESQLRKLKEVESETLIYIPNFESRVVFGPRSDGHWYTVGGLGPFGELEAVIEQSHGCELYVVRFSEKPYYLDRGSGKGFARSIPLIQEADRTRFVLTEAPSSPDVYEKNRKLYVGEEVLAGLEEHGFGFLVNFIEKERL